MSEATKTNQAPAKQKTAASGAKKTKAKPAVGSKAVKRSKPLKSTNKPTKTMEIIMTQGKTNFDKFTQDAAKTGKEHAEAFIESGNIFMKGLEDISGAYISWAQSSVEKNSQTAKALMGCKTINEYAETQNKWMQQNFDDLMAGMTKLSELSVKLASDAFEPINDHVSKSVRKITDSIAA